ncbi:MAG: protein kinase [Anaerolineae bacterium]|nr:protein kinase [Anaerolineae bacterium]
MEENILIFITLLLAIGGIVWWASRKSHTTNNTTNQRLQSQSNVCLVFLSGPRSGQTLSLIGEQVRIGRDPSSKVCIDDGLVSWNHAILIPNNGQYWLYDQDSTNGTWVNGQRIAQYSLRIDQDQVQIGPATFMVHNAEKPVGHIPASSSSTTDSTDVEMVYDFGNYHRVQTLGGGGAATVYKAISNQDGRAVAIKVLHQSQDPYLRDKFEKEGREIAQLLRHPHIIRVYGGGESEGVLYLVMEIMEGGTLRDVIASRSSLPLDRIVTILGQVCDALQYAHMQGVYHRDIKPENIFFTAEGQVKLGDFGIARLAQSMTRTANGWLVGTPSYMSYEQAKGHAIDGRSDLYSLGIVLYEMLTGHCPFVADDPLTVVDMHIQSHPVPPRKYNPNIPVEIEQVVMRALEKDKEKRFRTAEDMARSLGYTYPMHSGKEQNTVMSAYESGIQILPVASSQQVPVRSSSNGFSLVRNDGFCISLNGKNSVLLNRESVNPGDSEISRQHARIILNDTYYWIEDLGSANGTFVNGLRIFSPQLLNTGDRIQLGRTILTVAN